MTYQLKGGEEVRDGALFGWTGAACGNCGGTGESNEDRRCNDCGGTGEQWGCMPVQPPDLNPVFMSDAMARTLRMHTTAGAWDNSYSHAVAILASAGFTAAEVIEYAPEAVNIAKGAAA